MVRIICSCIRYVIQHLFSIETQSLCDRQQTHWTEGAFGINVKTFPISSAHVHWKLTCYRQSMTDLRFPCTELSKELSNSPSLDATTE